MMGEVTRRTVRRRRSKRNRRMEEKEGDIVQE